MVKDYAGQIQSGFHIYTCSWFCHYMSSVSINSHVADTYFLDDPLFSDNNKAWKDSPYRFFLQSPSCLILPKFLLFMILGELELLGPSGVVFLSRRFRQKTRYLVPESPVWRYIKVSPSQSSAVSSTFQRYLSA